MTLPDQSDWRQTRDAFERLRDLPAARREAELARWSRSDPAFATELRELLAADANPTVPLDLDAGALHAESVLREEHRELLGQTVAGYRLTERIGVGGTAAVFRGESQAGDVVAVKVLRATSASRPAVARFRQEQSITGAFDHPGLVRVLDAGELPDGRPFLISEFVAGRPIDRHCDDFALDHRARLALFLDVCHAVHHAHRHLVVHRDLKPANILVDTATGRPRVLDFGIAKLLDAERDPGWTEAFGRGPLTPAYASPEQIRGEPVTTASDVYSLGVLLYELLVGMSPYDVEPTERAALERAVMLEPPRSPSAHGKPALPRDLTTILAHCLHKHSGERYPSAEHLADDVQRYLEHRPLSARRDRWHVTLGKFARRQPLAASSLVAITALLLGGWAGARYRLDEVRASESIAWRAHADAAHATNTLANALASIAAHGDPSTDDVRAVLADAEAHADTLHDSPEAEARLRIALAGAWHRLESTDRAEANARRALTLTRDTRGLTWRDRERCLEILGDVLVLRGEDAAVEFARERVALLREQGSDRLESAEAQLRRIRGVLGETR